MTSPTRFDPATQTVGLTTDLLARIGPMRPDPPDPVEGYTVGVATMPQPAPHGGEMHPDGDEVLYLVSGEATVIFEDPALDDLTVRAGDGLVIPKGVWHRIDFDAPITVVYVTPGPRFEHRPVAKGSD